MEVIEIFRDLMNDPDFIIFIIIIVFFFYLMFRGIVVNRIKKNPKNWAKTTATITGRKESYDESHHVDGRYTIPSRVTRYQIEYSVDGKKYIKYVSDGETGGKKHGTIKIKYLIKRPSYFRVL